MDTQLMKSNVKAMSDLATGFLAAELKFYKSDPKNTKEYAIDVKNAILIAKMRGYDLTKPLDVLRLKRNKEEFEMVRAAAVAIRRLGLDPLKNSDQVKQMLEGKTNFGVFLQEYAKTALVIEDSLRSGWVQIMSTVDKVVSKKTDEMESEVKKGAAPSWMIEMVKNLNSGGKKAEIRGGTTRTEINAMVFKNIYGNFSDYENSMLGKLNELESKIKVELTSELYKSGEFAKKRNSAIASDKASKGKPNANTISVAKDIQAYFKNIRDEYGSFISEQSGKIAQYANNILGKPEAIKPTLYAMQPKMFTVDDMREMAAANEAQHNQARVARNFVLQPSTLAFEKNSDFAVAKLEDIIDKVRSS